MGQDFIRKLKEHLLGRLLGRDFDGDSHETFGPGDINRVRIFNNNIYSVGQMRVNYTTYDVRRDYDIINPKTHPFVMVSSPETEDGAHPFWYAQVLGVYHTVVGQTGVNRELEQREMTFLWVRWLGVEPSYRSGREYARLPKLGFVSEEDPFAFGFLDPAHVIRGCHLIPTFVAGRTDALLSSAVPTAARISDITNDWTNFYVNM